VRVAESLALIILMIQHATEAFARNPPALCLNLAPLPDREGLGDPSRLNHGTSHARPPLRC